jgi:hypothetical protein
MQGGDERRGSDDEECDDGKLDHHDDVVDPRRLVNADDQE